MKASQTATTASSDGDAFDLKRYLDVLVRRWRVIFALLVFAFLIAGLLVLRREAMYEAVSTVAIIRTRTSVDFNSSFETVTEEGLAASGVAEALDATARRSSLKGLVRNLAVAENVSVRLAELETFTPAELEPRRLLRSVSLLEQARNDPLAGSDLIFIVAEHEDSEKATAIADAWAMEYERYVNQLYSGSPTEYSASVNAELERAEASYQEAQAAVLDSIRNDELTRLQREIEEKQGILESLRTARTTAISAVFDEQIAAQVESIREYLRAESAAQILAFSKNQEAKRQMLAAYIDAEIQNRLAAFNRDREIRNQVFAQYVNAELAGQIAVFEQQVDEKTGTLSRYYAEQQRLLELHEDAQAMRTHLEEGGDTAAASNRLGLLSLKTEVFAAHAPLSATIQIDALALETPATAAEQLTDLDAVIVALESRITELEARIETASQELLAGTGYDFLGELSTANLTLGSEESSPDVEPDSLAFYINERYSELFDVGAMAQEAQALAVGTPLFDEIEALYSQLFEVDALMTLAESIPVDNPLSAAARERADELLQFTGFESLLRSSAGESEPLTVEIETLEADLRNLQAQFTTKQGERQQLEQARDLASETYTTLLRKSAELEISNAVSGSEVRFAGPASARIDSPLMENLRTLLTAEIAAFIIGVGVAFLIEYLAPGISPQRLAGKPEMPWNRVYRWVMTPSAGLSQRLAAARVGPSGTREARPSRG